MSKNRRYLTFNRGLPGRRRPTGTPALVGWMRAGTVAAILLFARCGYAMDLWDTYQLALQHDAIYRAAGLRQQSAQLDLPLAQSRFRPQITAGGELGKRRSGTTDDSHSAQLNLELPLYNRPDRVAIKQADLRTQSADLEYQAARYDLILFVAEQYFDLLSAIDNQEVARLEKVALRRQADLATQRFEVGLATEADVFDSQARLQQSQANIIQAQIRIDNARQGMRQIIGQEPQALAGLKLQTPLAPPQPDDPAIWIERALVGNLRLQADSLELEIARQEIDRQRFARSPTLGLNVNHRWSELPGRGLGSSATSAVGLNLNLPLYLAGSIPLRTRQAGLAHNIAEQSRESLKRQVVADATSAFLEITNSVSQVQALSEAIHAGSNSLDVKEQGFRVGLTTNLDVLDAQRDLSRTRSDYLRARYNYILAILRLQRTVGQLDDATLRRVNDWLDEHSTGTQFSLTALPASGAAADSAVPQ